MRTTVKLDDDVVVAIEQLRRQAPLGFSEALNKLARAGAAAVGAGTTRRQFKQPTVELGLLVDVSNIADVLETLDGDNDR